MWKQLPTINTLNSTMVGDLSFPWGVENLSKRLSLLGCCWEKACGGRKVIVKRQKFRSRANHVLCMPERFRGQGSLFHFS